MTDPTDATNLPADHLRLSIVVNNYNYARYLPEALDSVIRQMYDGDELIVVDDGSNDESPALLKAYELEHGIRLIQQENRGQMSAVRVGIKAARGDIVVLLDSDDYFLDGYLDRLRRIYTDHAEISFVFAAAQLGGDSIIALKNMGGVLHRLELTPGKVGKTKWSTLLFHEFVGVPTSGNSLHRSLANKIVALPASANETVVLPPILSKLLGISRTEQEKCCYTPDGVIVRCASIFESRKYYDDRPGFMYRMHGANRYATTSRLGRWYLLRRRKKQFSELIRPHVAINHTPTALGLRQEILGRSFGKHLTRRITIRSNYCRAILASEGRPREKLSALAAAIGLQQRIN